jgi:hypothetical protein
MSADDLFGKVVGRWEAMVEEMAATAEQYRDEGWEAVTLHPGDVTVVPAGHEQFGLVSVVSDDEFETLLSVVEDRTFSAYEVYCDATDAMVFLLVVTESDDGEAVVLSPGYYERTPDGEGELRSHDGDLFTRVRNLAGDDVVTFSHEDPDPFFPDERFDA